MILWYMQKDCNKVIIFVHKELVKKKDQELKTTMNNVVKMVNSIKS